MKINRVHNIEKYLLLTLIITIITVIFNSCSSNTEPPQEMYDNGQILKSDTILIFAPHPDDETLGFGGIIYEAINSGKTVKVIIVTNGDGYFEAGYFWKNGFPADDTIYKGNYPSKTEMETFGLVRLSESRNALSLLGLDSQNIITFGYPDGRLISLFSTPDNIAKGNTDRIKSTTGKEFSGTNLKEDIKQILRIFPTATIFTTHIQDGHSDHSSLAKFVNLACQDLQSEHLSFVCYWSIIHEPHSNDNAWPLPGLSWEPKRGEVLQQRELRYKPEDELTVPTFLTDTALYFRMADKLWLSKSGELPLLRRSIDCYKTQIGMIRMDSTKPESGYTAWIDKNGYLISFVKKNHLLWKAE